MTPGQSRAGSPVLCRSASSIASSASRRWIIDSAAGALFHGRAEKTEVATRVPWPRKAGGAKNPRFCPPVLPSRSDRPRARGRVSKNPSQPDVVDGYHEFLSSDIRRSRFQRQVQMRELRSVRFRQAVRRGPCHALGIAKYSLILIERYSHCERRLTLHNPPKFHDEEPPTSVPTSLSATYSLTEAGSCACRRDTALILASGGAGAGHGGGGHTAARKEMPSFPP